MNVSVNRQCKNKCLEICPKWAKMSIGLSRRTGSQAGYLDYKLKNIDQSKILYGIVTVHIIQQ